MPLDLTDTKTLVSQISKIGQAKDKKHLRQLLELLHHPNANVRKTASNALGKIGDPLAERSLMGMLFDDKPQVRQYALRALGRLGTHWSISAVTQIANNPDETEYNTRSAELCLKKISYRQQQAASVKKIQSTNIDIPSTAITGHSTLSPDQKETLSDLSSWLKNISSQHITLGGYAGTGKTTLIAYLRQLIKQTKPTTKIAFACYTGKASQVLRNKLVEQKTLYEQDFCGTIHSLMYSPITDEHGKLKSWTRNQSIPFDLIIIDEASMITKDVWQDLTSYGIPIIAVGDHGQLPPIDDNFNLMDNPQLKLEKIHRQAQDNPIIQIATLARTTGNIPYKYYSDTIIKTDRSSDLTSSLINNLDSQTLDDTLILCGFNRTRVALNRQVRQVLGHDYPEPQIGERLICLKNNYDNKDGPIYNGMVGKLNAITPKSKHWYTVDIDFVDEQRNFRGDISSHQFNQPKFVEDVDGLHYAQIGDRFDFGYALTVHKAQGSQSNTVILFEEKAPFWQGDIWNRWLYTAVTRASENLYIIG